MTGELVVRFLVGGALVSLFAILGDVFELKTFGGLFGAAPSVAIASLALSIHGHGGSYGAVEARAMILGAVGLFVYSSWIAWSLHRHLVRTGTAIISALALWFVAAGVGWTGCSSPFPRSHPQRFSC